MAKKIRKPAQGRVKMSNQSKRITTPFTERKVDRRYLEAQRKEAEAEAELKAFNANEKIDLNNIL